MSSIPKKLLAAAEDALTRYPNAPFVTVTEDGNAWLPGNASLAEHHARQERLPKPVTVTRADVGLEPVVIGAEPVTTPAKGSDEEPPVNEAEGSEAATSAEEATVEHGTPRGADLLGDVVSLGKKKEVESTVVVQRSFVDSGLTMQEWNSLDDDAILEHLFETIEALKKEA
ncbi:MAG: hypothetical protein JNL05_10545 [Flavobacteriales bacterium]|nr:hypothetical protein [Flavobacteriales bacterium]